MRYDQPHEAVDDQDEQRNQHSLYDQQHRPTAFPSDAIAQSLAHDYQEDLEPAAQHPQHAGDEEHFEDDAADVGEV